MNHFSKDIKSIIINKISLDYTLYKFWCNVDSKWIYIWSENECVCPNNKEHEIDFIKVIDTVKANNNIIKLITVKVGNDITETKFEFIYL